MGHGVPTPWVYSPLDILTPPTHTHALETSPPTYPHLSGDMNYPPWTDTCENITSLYIHLRTEIRSATRSFNQPG